jgi:hypothetical protein
MKRVKEFNTTRMEVSRFRFNSGVRIPGHFVWLASLQATAVGPISYIFGTARKKADEKKDSLKSELELWAFDP